MKITGKFTVDGLTFEKFIIEKKELEKIVGKPVKFEGQVVGKVIDTWCAEKDKCLNVKLDLGLLNLFGDKKDEEG